MFSCNLFYLIQAGYSGSVRRIQTATGISGFTLAGQDLFPGVSTAVVTGFVAAGEVMGRPLLLEFEDAY